MVEVRSLEGPQGAPTVKRRALIVGSEAEREVLLRIGTEERRRLRRDLHDWLGPLLTGVALTTDAAFNMIEDDPDQARTFLRRARNELSEAMDEMRRLVADLPPAALDDLGLAQAIERHSARIPSLEVTVHCDGPIPHLPAAVGTAAYLIIIEALNNAARHSNAQHARVGLRMTTVLAVEVTDDGHGPRQWTDGNGLTSMRERAAELGGAISFGPTQPVGGRVMVRLPVEVEHVDPCARR